jgi:transcriptional regulator with PAS, ATPase and Fis domain
MKNRLLDILAENHDLIVENWINTVLDTIPAYRRQPVDLLRKNILAGLEGLFEFIEKGSTGKLSKALRGVANVRLPENFTVGEVMRAILCGKSAIMSVITAKGIPAEARLTHFGPIDAFFDEAVTAFAGIFQEMRRELAYLKNIMGKEFKLGNIIGKSKRMREIFSLIPRVADSPTSVLITGKSGTGKELVAKAIHFHSQRRNNNFVAVNCSALPETLLESEMFGYVRGAFTGATTDKDGLFQEAEGGTVFLDEIGDMSLQLQAKLLRVLQEKEYKKVGGTKTFRADVRVITATNKDLYREMARGSFREDLYYRINVIAIHLPPLKERREDIPLLVRHFVAKYNTETGREIERIGTGAMKTLMGYNWPGNVRELENTIERAVILCDGEEITAADLSPAIHEYDPDRASREHTESGSRSLPHVSELERREIIKALTETHFHRTKAAERLGMNRKTLYRKMKRYGIS